MVQREGFGAPAVLGMVGGSRGSGGEEELGTMWKLSAAAGPEFASLMEKVGGWGDGRAWCVVPQKVGWWDGGSGWCATPEKVGWVGRLVIRGWGGRHGGEREEESGEVRQAKTPLPKPQETSLSFLCTVLF